MTRIAITRDVSTSLGDCQLSFVARTALDVDRARQQHRAYCDALHALGCRVLALAPQHDLPDAVFVEDTAVVLDELAVLTRPGAQARRDEVASVAAALAEWRPLAGIVSPGTLDGGDVLRIGRRLYVGASARSNTAGIAQLAALVEPHGYSVQAVATHGCLHLKSAVTALADDLVLIQPAWIDARVFAHLRRIDVDPSEDHAANALRVGSGVIYPAAFPRTRARIEAAGIDVRVVDVGELQKAEGAVTCCSLVFEGYGSVEHGASSAQRIDQKRASRGR